MKTNVPTMSRSFYHPRDKSIISITERYKYCPVSEFQGKWQDLDHQVKARTKDLTLKVKARTMDFQRVLKDCPRPGLRPRTNITAH